jgi:hypothetical protein
MFVTALSIFVKVYAILFCFYFRNLVAWVNAFYEKRQQKMFYSSFLLRGYVLCLNLARSLLEQKSTAVCKNWIASFNGTLSIRLTH